MSQFSIDNILSNQKYIFKLSKVIFDEEISHDLEFTTPKFPTRMDKVNLFYRKYVDIVKTFYSDDNTIYKIKKFQIKSTKNNLSVARFFITDVTHLKPNDKIIFTTSGAQALANFNGASATIGLVNKNPSQPYVDVINMNNSLFTATSQTYSPPFNQNYFQEFKRQVVEEAFDLFIESRTDFLRNKLIWNSYVRDVIIFAYASVSDPNIKVDQITSRYLIGNDEKINWQNNSNPPTYSTLTSLEYLQQSNIIHKQRWSNASNAGAVYFWAAVARYKNPQGVIGQNIDSNWTGEWLQLDSNKNAIWTPVAKERKK